MIGLLQRVLWARVAAGGTVVAEIGPGLLVFLGLEQADDLAAGMRLVDRILGFRVFADAQGRMNRSLADTGGELLLVPQFTLVADTGRGLRPAFGRALAPGPAAALFASVCGYAQVRHERTAAGEFGADMQVSLLNDGPATFWLQTPTARRMKD